MCEQTMLYSVGTLLWFKTPLKIWWPVKVVDPSTMPADLHNYRDTMKDKTLAVVKFMTANKYELVTKMESVCLYSSQNKMDFIEKGYSKYLEQENGVKYKYNMEYFIQDIKNFEKEIQGDENIFIKVKENIAHKKKNSNEYNQIVSTLFKSTKQTKKKVKKTAIPKIKINKSHSHCTPNLQTQSTTRGTPHTQTNTRRKTTDESEMENSCSNRLVNDIDGIECSNYSMFGKTISKDEWEKHNSWVAFENNGMDEDYVDHIKECLLKRQFQSRNYASAIMNMSIMSLEPHDFKPVQEEEPPFKDPIFCGAPYDENPNSYKLFQAPKVPPKYTDEELVQLPEFKMIRELLDSGQQDAVTVTVMGAKRIKNPLDTFN